MADPRLAQYLAVVRVQPRIGWEEDVSTNPYIRVWFNIPVQESLVNTDEALNQYVTLVHLGTDTAVPVTFVSWNTAERLLTFAPSGDLSTGGIYQCTINRDLQSAQGRRMVDHRFWSFQVSSASLETPVLQSPGDATAWRQTPTLQWEGVGGASASGNVSYEVQVHRDWQFIPPLLWSTTITATSSGGNQSASIGTSLSQEQSYFWRVRAYTTSVTGDWSEVQNFYLGTTTQASPDAAALYTPETEFRVLDMLPDTGTSNLRAWPTIRITLSKDPTSGSVNGSSIYLQRMPVDGQATSGAVTVAADLTVVDGVVDLAPTEDIQANTRYTVTINTRVSDSDGNTLPSEDTLYFTSYYQPCYGGTISVRALLGGFIEDVSEDELLFHLWKASLYVNEVVYSNRRRSGDARERMTMRDLVNYQIPGGVTWGVVRIAETLCALTLLDGYYYDVAKDAGIKMSLATFDYQVAVELLAELRAKIKDLRAQYEQLLATFLYASVVPRTGIKSQYWEEEGTAAIDWAYEGIQRSNPRPNPNTRRQPPSTGRSQF